MSADALVAAALLQLLVTPWAGPDGPDRDIALHHARAAITVQPTRALVGRLEVDGGAGEEEALVDAWAGWSPRAPLQVRLGWMRAPLGLASQRSFWDVRMPDRPGAARLAGDLRGPGAAARLQLIERWLVAHLGWVRAGADERLLASGRVEATAGPFTLGVGGTLDYDAAADLRVTWAGGELVAGHQRGRSRLGRLARGSWVEAAQHVLGPRWWLLVRGETVDDDAARSDTGDARVWTAGVGLNLLAGARGQLLWLHREELDRDGVGVIALNDDRVVLTLALDASAD